MRYPPGRSRIRWSRRRSGWSTRGGGCRWRCGTGWGSGWMMRCSRRRSGCGAVRGGRRRGWRWWRCCSSRARQTSGTTRAW